MPHTPIMWIHWAIVQTLTHTLAHTMCPPQLSSTAYTSTARFHWSIKFNIFGKTLWMCRHCASILFECNIIRLYLICSPRAFFIFHSFFLLSCCVPFAFSHINEVEMEMEMKKRMGREKTVAKNEKQSEKKSRKSLAFITLSSGLYRRKEFSILELHFYMWFFLFVRLFIHSLSLCFPVLLVSIWYVMLLSQFDIFTLSAHWILLHRIGNAYLSRRLLIFVDVVWFYFCTRTRALTPFPFHFDWWCIYELISKTHPKTFHWHFIFPTKIEWCRKQ